MTENAPPPETHEQHIARLIRRAEREREARRQSERLLDQKSRELFETNRALEAAHRAQKQTADQLMAILDNMPIAVLFASPEGQVEWVNAVVPSMFDLTAEEARMQSIGEFMPQLAEPDIMAAAMAGTPNDSMVTTARKADGVEFPAEVTFNVVSTQAGTSMIWMVRDITHRVAQEQRRQELEEDLRRAQRLESLGTMAGGIAHELNTPIQFITDNTNFLLGAFKDMAAAIDDLKSLATDKASEVIAKHDVPYLLDEVPGAISQSLDGLKRVAEIVLAIKRFSHPTSAAKEDNDLNQIVQTTILVSKNQWKYVADMELDLAADLPRIRSNAGELNQVLLNLIVNAAHAIEDKGNKGELGKIKISTRAVDGGIECRIQDSGVGIKQEIKDKVFDLFFTTKAPGRGTGQGLALVHSIVTQSHGGRIAIESEPGQGTTFVFVLPTGGAPGGSVTGDTVQGKVDAA